MAKITYKNLKLVIEQLKAMGYQKEAHLSNIAKAIAISLDIGHTYGIKQAIKSMETLGMLRYKGNQIWEIVEGEE